MSHNKDTYIHEILANRRYLVAEPLIEKLVKEGIEESKLPVNLSIDEDTKKELINIVNAKVDRLDGIDSIVDTVIAFVAGYSHGLAFATEDKEIVDL